MFSPLRIMKCLLVIILTSGIILDAKPITWRSINERKFENGYPKLVNVHVRFSNEVFKDLIEPWEIREREAAKFDTNSKYYQLIKEDVNDNSTRLWVNTENDEVTVPAYIFEILVGGGTGAMYNLEQMVFETQEVIGETDEGEDHDGAPRRMGPIIIDMQQNMTRGW